MQISLNIKNESIFHEYTADKKESLSTFAGIWKDRDIDIHTIRESAWKK